ncbi:hypothetical protein K432DRAFT_450246 [Lepidopterella palustris CBS 459.81]|uniref:Uncharacterized protein n=1 Tax=Lepidopterella palustris CBS 459.81 TaxID=1314670 RepID=A0A8E2EKP4_9PEZI|nr:hypothetical protein K432DRAFT_450246 [Lepidopterella palustris CBS 459.81]
MVPKVNSAIEAHEVGGGKTFSNVSTAPSKMAMFIIFVVVRMANMMRSAGSTTHGLKCTIAEFKGFERRACPSCEILIISLLRTSPPPSLSQSPTWRPGSDGADERRDAAVAINARRNSPACPATNPQPSFPFIRFNLPISAQPFLLPVEVQTAPSSSLEQPQRIDAPYNDLHVARSSSRQGNLPCSIWPQDTIHHHVYVPGRVCFTLLKRCRVKIKGHVECPFDQRQSSIVVVAIITLGQQASSSSREE